jgi:hypothetical protein
MLKELIVKNSKLHALESLRNPEIVALYIERVLKQAIEIMEREKRFIIMHGPNHGYMECTQKNILYELDLMHPTDNDEKNRLEFSGFTPEQIENGIWSLMECGLSTYGKGVEDQKRIYFSLETNDQNQSNIKYYDQKGNVGELSPSTLGVIHDILFINQFPFLLEKYFDKPNQFQSLLNDPRLPGLFSHLDGLYLMFAYGIEKQAEVIRKHKNGVSPQSSHELLMSMGLSGEDHFNLISEILSNAQIERPNSMFKN